MEFKIGDRFYHSKGFYCTLKGMSIPFSETYVIVLPDGEAELYAAAINNLTPLVTKSPAGNLINQVIDL